MTRGHPSFLQAAWGARACRGLRSSRTVYGRVAPPGNRDAFNIGCTMTLSLYDTMTRAKREFVPRNPDRVTMYVCGPTVYNFAHIGNFRPVVVFDLLFRV